MKSNYFKKLLLMLSVSFVLTMIFSTASTYAATLKQPLLEPESGWTRFDDTDPAIKFLGTGWTAWKATASADKGIHYNDTFHGQVDNKDVSGTVKFQFTGTGVRIIGYANGASGYAFASDVLISVDGVEEHFPMNYTAKQARTLVYEKVGLEEGLHTVELKTIKPVTRGMNVDAVDIQGGELQDIDIPMNLNAEPGNSSVKLNWNPVEAAESYVIRYGTESGKYTETVTAKKDEYGNFVIPGLTNGTTYYFEVSAVVNGVESEYSNEAFATPQEQEQPTPEPPEPTTPEQPSGNRAILVITMTTGLEKEFDLSMQEVNSFIDWYENKQAGVGKASYAIDKHDNNKGPFKSRKDYILFDRVLTFEVSEY